MPINDTVLFVNEGVSVNVAVVGTGYVGLVAACCLAHSGHRVIAVEKEKKKLAKLEKGIIPIFEAGLDDILSDVTKSGRIKFTGDLEEALAGSVVVVVAVGTPSELDGRTDLSQVEEIARAIAQFAKRPLTVVMKSTVPPGIGKALCEKYFSKARVPIRYVSNPEFLREGRAVSDWYNPDRIVIGSDDTEAVELVLDLYSDIDAPKIKMGITSAEMAKYASNAFLATKISFINEIANLCEKVGADIDSVAEVVGMDKRIGSHFLHAGLGYGGSCFPKDTKGLNYVSTFSGYDFKLLRAVIEVNAKQRSLVVNKLLKELGSLKGRRVAVLGIAFKPGTDDIREAPAIDIIKQLISEGAIVSASDPMAVDNARRVFSEREVRFFDDPYAACKSCAAIILATEWGEFLALDWSRIKDEMESPYAVFDGRNALDKEQMLRYGFSYLAIGRVVSVEGSFAGSLTDGAI